jgi:hypothetical protein
MCTDAMDDNGRCPYGLGNQSATRALDVLGVLKQPMTLTYNVIILASYVLVLMLLFHINLKRTVR